MDPFGSWDQWTEVVQSKRNNQVVANAMDFTAKRIYMATAGLSQGLNKRWGQGRAGGKPWLVYNMKRSNGKIMFRNDIVGVAALRLHQATKVWNIWAIVVGFSTYVFSIFLRQPHHKVLLGTPIGEM